MPIVALSTQIRPFVYTDVNVNYLIDNLPVLVHDIDAINQQLINLFSTVPGERIFEPEFGSYITSFLFDPTDPITAWRITIEARIAIQRWMPRITFDTDRSTVIPDYQNRAFDATIAYSIAALNVGASLQLKLTLA